MVDTPPFQKIMKPLIIANWKMHPQNSKDAFDLAGAVKRGIEDLEVDVVLCPPFPYISQLLPSSNMFVGAQDCFWEQEGAYTGEVSAQMLKNLGCSYVIVGHSEREKYLKETLEMGVKKLKAALQVGLIPILCIGENVEQELQEVLKKVGQKDISKIVYVYEPESAISTSENVKPVDPKAAEAAKQKIRDTIGQDVTILYGGSVNSKDVGDFLAVGFQGVLVGAASLDKGEFLALVKNAIEA